MRKILLSLAVHLLVLAASAQVSIREAKADETPSIQTGWRFNFQKRLKELQYSKAYVLTSKDTPADIKFIVPEPQ